MRIAPLALALALALADAPAAPAQTLDASSPWKLGEVMKAAGYRATLESDNAGNPVIRSGTGGVNFSIYFYGCRDGQNCRSIQFSSGFKLREPVEPALMNDWNGRKRFARGWADADGNTFLRLDMNLVGGVTEKNFADTLDLWSILLGDFVKHIGWRG